jgi:PAS domain S-box-containing protein
MQFPHFLRSKNFFLGLPILLLIVTLFSGLMLVRFLEGVGYGHLREQSGDIMEAMTAGIQNELQSAQSAAGAMAGSPWILPVLLDPDPQNVENANSVLDRYNTNLGFSVCYLLDPRGNALASSNRSAANSFVGKNYAFRPYFQEALRGKASLYMATGVTSRERGFYAAHSVQDEGGKVLGVAVIKKSIEATQNILGGHPNAFFINPDGIIFISGSSEMVFRTLWPLESARIRAIKDSRQFEMASFDPVFPKSFQDGEKVFFRGESYQSFRRPLGTPGWSLVLLAPLKSVFYFTLFGWIVTAFTTGVILILTLWTVWRMKGQELLRQSEESLRKFQRAIEQSPATVVITDRTGAIEYVNPKFTEMTGYTREEALGKNPRILKSGELPDEAYKELWEMIVAGKEWRGEFHNKRKNGELFWEFASISPIRNARGTITHFLAVKEDITERKRAEEALKQKVLELERFNRIAVGRELRMIELKEKLKALEAKKNIKD